MCYGKRAQRHVFMCPTPTLMPCIMPLFIYVYACVRHTFLLHLGALGLCHPPVPPLIVIVRVSL